MEDPVRPTSESSRSFFRSERARLSAATRAALRSLGSAHRTRRRTAPAGARPDHMVIASDAIRPRFDRISYTPEVSDVASDVDLEDLRTALQRDDIDWINVCGFGDEDTLRDFGELFGIHPLAMADIVNVPQRPKLDSYGDRHLIVLRMARWIDGQVQLQQISLVLGPTWVITFEEHPGDVFEPVRARIRSEGNRLRASGADYLAYALIDAVVDSFLVVLEQLSDRLEELEELSIGRPQAETLARIHAARRLLLTLERVQRQQRDAVFALVRSDEQVFRREIQPYLRDVQDHAVHILDTIESYREVTVGLMDIYLSSVSNRTNDVMKVLTIMASVFIPLTFLAGVYGMNFEHMPELRWRWGYPAVWAVMLGSGGLLLLFFRRRGWLALSSLDGEPEESDEL